jgi:dihydroflavonol-4-reductase
MRGGGASLSRGSVAIVTGATGFLGSALVDTLVERGVKVRCLTRARPRASEAAAHPSVEWHVVDWTSTQALDRTAVFDGAGVVFHLAGVTKALSPKTFRAGNVRPTELLLAALVRRAEPIERFGLVSSQAAAGPARTLATPRRELDAPAPIDAYGSSKREAEQLLEAYGTQLPWTIVRPSSVYGPRDRDFLEVFRQVRRGLWIYPATRDRWLSLAHVDDVVSGMLAAAQTPTAVTWRDVYGAAGRACGARKLLELDLPQIAVNVAGHLGDLAARVTRHVGLVNSQKVALGRAPYWVCSPERAKAELGIEASIPMDEGMKQTYDWYVRAGWL